MECSVIIPTRRRAGLLRETLDSLCQQTERDFGVIVVVDGEDPETRAFASDYNPPFPLRWIFVPEHKGQASAKNAGAAEAESEILVFLDDDTPPVPDWLYHHLKHHRENHGQDEIGVLGKVADRYVNPPRSRTEQYLRETREPALAHFEECLKQQSLEFGRIAAFGLNTSIRRKTFLAVGGFDPRLSFLDEDTDLGARLYKYSVHFILEPRAIVHHRDTKDAITAHFAIARAAGKVDLYRRRKKQQYNGRLQLLSQMHCGSPVRKLVHRTAWHAPWAFQVAASLSRKVTDLTGSRKSFRLWYRTAAAEYWRGIREAGETTESLSALYPAVTPILMLHSVSTPDELRLKSLHITPERFERYMAWLKRTGYTSVLPAEWDLYGRGANGRRVILTFDDAYEDFLTSAFPVLDRLGLSATVFVVIDRMGKTNDWDEAVGFKPKRLLSREQIRELHGQGVHFGSHSLTHPRLTELSDTDLEREVSDSKHKLEDLLGSEVSGFCYPWGFADMRVRSAVARAGYRIAVTTREGLNCSEDPLNLKRINLAEVDTLPEFMLKLTTGKDYRQLVKRYLIAKGLYPDHQKAVQEQDGRGHGGNLAESHESAGMKAPKIPDAEP